MLNLRKTLHFSFLGCLVLGAIACTPSGDPASTSTGTGTGTSADSGVDMIRYPVPDDATVSFTVWFKVGSQNDPPGKEGLAALTGDMVSDGATANNTYEQILEKLYPLASGYGVRVDKEMTTVQGRTHVDNVDHYFPLFSDAFAAPAFTEEDFERLRSDQLNYLEKTLRYSSDEDLGKAALVSFIFDGTTYENPTEGTVQGLESITLDDVKAFYQQHYTQANAMLAIGGGFDAALEAKFQATLGQLPAGETTTSPAINPAAIDGRKVLLVDKPDADASISFGFPINAPRGSRDYYALWIANSWLGEHRNSSSHLYQVIRETRGMNYGDYSYIEAFPQGGQRQMPPPNVARQHQLFQIWIRTLPNEEALFATRAALRELTHLVQQGMSEEAFALTRSFLRNYHLHFAETTQDRLGYAVDDRFYGIGGEGHLAQFGEMLESITREEVNAALERHLQLENIKFAIVTGDAEGLREVMVNDTATPKTYASEKPAEIVAEDKEIEVVPFNLDADDVTIVAVDTIFEG